MDLFYSPLARHGNGGFGRATCDARLSTMRHATVASRKVVMSLAHVARRMSRVPPPKKRPEAIDSRLTFRT